VPVSPEILVVLAIVLAALVLFATEAAPVDVTAIGIMVSLLLAEPVTEAAAGVGLLGESFALVSPEQGISGFASVATVTVLAMFILSAGVERTGIVETLGERVSSFTGNSERRQLGATIGIVGPISGFINNTAAVAILMPMVSDLAKKGGTSPSKLLLPLSYASMFGGTLTLIGTSTNILASDLSARLIGEPFSMFEFTKLGVIVALVGTAYLFTVGWWLTPERIKAEEDLTTDFGLSEYLTEVVVREESPLIGQTVREALASMEGDVDVVQLIRENRTFGEPLGQKVIRGGDVFVVRTDRESLIDVSEGEGLDLLPEIEVSDAELETTEQNQGLVEVVVAPRSSLIGETLATIRFRERYDATVLALRRGPELMRSRLDRVSLRVGDTLLVQATEDSLGRLNRNRDFIVAQRVERAQYRREKVPVAVGIVLGVVALAALDVMPIVVSALTGALAMVVTGCLKPPELYDAVQWDVIFLLAGVIPLGIAMEQTGTANLIADGVVASAELLPPIGVLALFYVVTALLTNVVSNNASVVLMIPVAVEAATRIGAEPFAFVLAVTFAASTAFMTPVGYQTNLFVYGPGGYRFSDYVRVGGPLQLLLAIVTTVGIWFFWL